MVQTVRKGVPEDDKIIQQKMVPTEELLEGKIYTNAGIYNSS